MLRRPQHSVVSDRNVFGIFVPLSPALLIGFTHEANIALEAGLAKFCFSLLFSSCFTHGNKAPSFLFHVLKADVNSRALSSHFVSCSKCWMLPRHIYPMGHLVPKETRMIAEGVILDALL